MMRWFLKGQIGLSVVMAGLLAGMAIPVSAQEEHPVVDPSLMPQESAAVETPMIERRVLYIFSQDFPPGAASYPIPSANETKFWQLMDYEMQQTDTLALTENLEEADYRVDLRCAGLGCSSIRVDVKTIDRDVLTSFKVKSRLPVIGVTNLEKVTHDLTRKLDHRIRLLDKGGYGYMP